MDNLNRKDVITRYCRLILKIAINLQDEQSIVVSCNTKFEYIIKYLNEEVKKISSGKIVLSLYSDKDSITDEIERLENLFYLLRTKKTAYLSIRDNLSFHDFFCNEPEKEIEYYLIKTKISELLSTNQTQYSTMILPSPKWAKLMYDNTNTNDLWIYISNYLSLANEDFLNIWLKIKVKLMQTCNNLNTLELSNLTIETSKNNKLNIGLPSNHTWITAFMETNDGIQFTPNMPTKEIFTAPSKYKVNGHISIEKPLNLYGTIIRNIELDFLIGEVNGFNSDDNESLEWLFDFDNCNKYLGEVALVDTEDNLIIPNIFYETLFDENNGCHIALGRAYTQCIDSKKSTSDIINSSKNHCDLVLSKDIKIYGIDKNSNKIVLYENRRVCV